MIAILSVMINSGNNGGNAGGNCAGCHGGSTDAGGVLELVGAPTTYYYGVSYTFDICLTDPSKVAGGFTLESNIGTLNNGDGTSQISGGKATHNGKKFFTANQACWAMQWTAPSSGTTDLQFNFRGNAVNNNGGTSGDNGGYISSVGGIALPVKFASFEVFHSQKGVQVNWSTASEINNEAFVVQRSIDNEFYEDIKVVDVSADSRILKNYEYVDTQSPSGALYYRILQRDIDGSIDYSEVRTIVNLIANVPVRIFPNPVSTPNNSITIEGMGSTIHIHSSDGRLLQSYSDYNTSIILPNTLSTGSYYITDGVLTKPIHIIR